MSAGGSACRECPMGSDIAFESDSTGDGQHQRELARLDVNAGRESIY
jgi:hypothetical protein